MRRSLRAAAVALKTAGTGGPKVGEEAIWLASVGGTVRRHKSVSLFPLKASRASQLCAPPPWGEVNWRLEEAGESGGGGGGYVLARSGLIPGGPAASC